MSSRSVPRRDRDCRSDDVERALSRVTPLRSSRPVARRTGFIAPDHGGPDLFVHHSSIPTSGDRALREGHRVSFAVEPGAIGPWAVKVVRLHPLRRDLSSDRSSYRRAPRSCSPRSLGRPSLLAFAPADGSIAMFWPAAGGRSTCDGRSRPAS
ncbi:cold-shock protein [Plantactinospora solaniradicis]|uniref:Cold-shock protein n=1 Tax=Plantactinospora solaniradicis TaxID=1723736 RepID=A0ABW1KJU5_9ACTN